MRLAWYRLSQYPRMATAVGFEKVELAKERLLAVKVSEEKC